MADEAQAGAGAAGDAGAEVEVDWSAFRELLGGDTGPERGAPARGLVVAAVVLWAAALVMVGVTWNGVAERTDVALQLPIMVSGGLSAIVLSVVGAALFVAGHLRGR